MDIYNNIKVTTDFAIKQPDMKDSLVRFMVLTNPSFFHKMLIFDKEESIYDISTNNITTFVARKIDNDLYIEKIHTLFGHRFGYIMEQFDAVYIHKNSCVDRRTKKFIINFIKGKFNLSENENYFICKI